MLVRRFPRAIRSLPALVAFVREFFTARGIDADRAFDVDLVLEELFTNMVRHARGGAPEIEVGLEDDGAALTLRLRDEGAEPWDPPASPAPGPDPTSHEARPGGRGIPIVRELTRELRFEHVDGATIVTAVLEVPR
ncbi:MAG: ATP-binding protein [Candidatus Eiseniibacteriota bacterium]